MTLRPVSKDEFFKAIGPQDVRPRSEKDASYWETPNRTLIGKSTPGYLCRDENGRYADKRSYWLAS